LKTFDNACFFELLLGGLFLPSFPLGEEDLEMAEIKKKKKETPKIDIFKAWCKACGICVAFCPTSALAKDEAGNPYVKDIDKCINCGWCEIRCPDFAITVETKAEGSKRIEVKGGEEEPKPKEEDVSPERIVAPGQ
jgi:2-oxoglutarate ferredoxin oxidoreductase subunit delta